MSTLTETAPSAAATFVAFAPKPTAPKIAAARRSLPWKKILAGAAAVALIASATGRYLYRAAGVETTEDAYLEGHVHAVSARINGTVARVLVEDNARVTAGQPLVEIDSAEQALAVEEATANLAQARAAAHQVVAEISRAEAEVTAGTARIAQNAAELHRAELDLRRAETLGSDAVGAISKQQLDAARAGFDATDAARQSLLAQKASAEAGLAAAQAQQSVAIAQVQKAEAALDTAKLQNDYTVVRAPVAGRIGKKAVEAGQRLQPGQPVMAIVDDDVWVVANFKESQLAHLRAGQKVSVQVDAVEGHTFTGVVQSMSPGTGAKFSLLPPDNSTGNFSKIVQRVPVKILLSAESVGGDADRLFPGLSAVVEVGVRAE